MVRAGKRALDNRYEKKYGRDETEGIPRCLMAAKFRTEHDPTGENTLKHWISPGQIQELPPTSISRALHSL